ncbi:hypothetical protein Cni_G08019 [Canna indica]|uniref:Uncharacterized protein n=1 Tax=Canna indica TaxID=4628 RepID=A0AAQ3Q7Z1_9LILI|nr:hypothetical protein Cni_G08019 [Canna indica]
MTRIRAGTRETLRHPSRDCIARIFITELGIGGNGEGVWELLMVTMMTTTEEFDEADVLWPDDDVRDGANEDGLAEQRRRRGARRKAASTNPVEIPSGRRAVHGAADCNKCSSSFGGDDDEDDGGGGDCCRIPPHVIVARRGGDRTSTGLSPVCDGCGGDGRRLKGRELCYVRNVILRMTGFIET